MKEMKALAKPPPALDTIMAIVMVFLGKKPDCDSVKKGFSNYQSVDGFLNAVSKFDRDSVTRKTVKLVEKKYVERLVHPDRAMMYSLAGGHLCQWVHSLLDYSKLKTILRSKKDNKSILEQLIA